MFSEQNLMYNLQCSFKTSNKLSVPRLFSYLHAVNLILWGGSLRDFLLLRRFFLLCTVLYAKVILNTTPNRNKMWSVCGISAWALCIELLVTNVNEPWARSIVSWPEGFAGEKQLSWQCHVLVWKQTTIRLSKIHPTPKFSQSTRLIGILAADTNQFYFCNELFRFILSP